MSKAASGRLQTRDFIGSAAGFGAVLMTLVVLDPRVGHRFERAFYPNPTEKLLSWGERLGDLGGVLVQVVRDQGADNAPLLTLTVVAILLTGFMLRT